VIFEQIRRCVSCACFLLFAVAGNGISREVAITIDDLPRGGDAQGSLEADLNMTTKLLAIFQRDHIPLTGFVNECHRTEELRPLLRLWVAAGADLGNHTCSHPDLNKTSVTDFEAQIVQGEAITTEILGHRPTYFRYPFLHEGDTAEKKAEIQRFLTTHQYKNAPVTLDNSDYLFAAYYAKMLAADNVPEAQHIRDAYLAYMESIFAFFDRFY
jgi:peptidoglycan-N-acetylglucosamine deacetylase